MTFTQVKDTIIRMIRYRVSILNSNTKFLDFGSEMVDRFKIEIDVLLLCLNNICSDEHWSITYFVDYTEFGYYDNNGDWVSVEK